MTIAARLRHQAIRERLEARDESDIHDLLTAHVSGYIDLTAPTPYAPGTREKRAVMSARYRLGMTRLFVDGDRLDWERVR